MRNSRRVLIHVLYLSTLLSCAATFGTINEPTVVGQHCEHERITRVALACPPGIATSDGRCFEELSLHQLAGRTEEYVGQGSNGAVGAPDMLDPIPEGPEAHCDNADYLDSAFLGLGHVYPITRDEATSQLQTCVNHLRLRLAEGVDAADRIVDVDARVISPHVDISMLDCRFSFPALQMRNFGRAKCAAIEGFGRALHGVQDFYAHSNWADEARPPFGLENPPGLKRDDYPSFLDLRAEDSISDQVPRNLSTGCFGGLLTDGPEGKAGHPLEPGSLDCTGRITHHTLNKDNGIIDHVTGIASDIGHKTPRSDHPGNFQRAVSAAIRDTRRQWRHFREEIRRIYGTQRGNIIICALVRDSPTDDCYGRRVAVLRDVEKHTKRVAEMQIPIHAWLLDELDGRAHDEGPGEGLTPQNSTKSRGSSDELRAIGINNDSIHIPFVKDSVDLANLDIEGALTRLRENPTSHPSNKTAVVALTGAYSTLLADQIASIWRAGDEDVRVHLGFLPPADQHLLEAREEDLITAVLRTGGTYSILHQRRAISAFLDHVVSRGLTHYDNAQDTATLLPPGLSIRDYVTPASEPRRFSFNAHTMDTVIVAVAPITPRLSLHVNVRHVRMNLVIQELDIGLAGNATFRAELGAEDIPRTDAWFELEVAHIEGDELVGSGLFEVSVEAERVESRANLKEPEAHDEL